MGRWGRNSLLGVLTAVMSVTAAPWLPATAADGPSAGETYQQLRARRQQELSVDVMDEQVGKAWQRYIDSPPGKHNPRDLLTLQANWDQVQAAAHRGQISPKQNDRFLVDHGADMSARINRAAEAQGLSSSLQEPSGAQKTYSDTDGHLRSGEADLTPERIRQVRTQFNDEFRRDLADHGLPDIDNPARRMRTDAMPITDDPELFRRVERIINPDGGMMYGDFDAVKQEIATRGGPPAELKDKVAHVQEQIRQIRGHHREALHNIDKGRRLMRENPVDSDEYRRGLRLLEEAHGEGASPGGKYERRLHGSTNDIAQETGGQRQVRRQARADAVDAVNTTRDVSVNREASLLNSSHQAEIFRTQRRNVRNLAGSGNLAEAAELARNATPAQRGQLLEEARQAIAQREARSLRRSGLGLDQDSIERIAAQRADQQTRRLAGEMRRNATPDRRIPGEHGWEINSTYEPTATRHAAATDLPEAAPTTPRTPRNSPADVWAPQPGSKVTRLDQPGPAVRGNPPPKTHVLGAVATGLEVGGQLVERSTRQMGDMIDQNRDPTLNDAWQVGRDMVPGVTGYDASQQMLLDRQVQRIRRQQRIAALERQRERSLDQEIELIHLRSDERQNPDTAAGNAQAVVRDGLVSYIDKMEADARAAGRSRADFWEDYVPMVGRMSRDAINAVNPINQLGTPIAEIAAQSSTFDERADWAAQQDAMLQFVNGRATRYDASTSKATAELDRLLTQGDLKDPAVRQRVDQLLAQIANNRAQIDALIATVESGYGGIGRDKFDTLYGIDRGHPDPASLNDYAGQMIAERTDAAVGASGTEPVVAAGEQGDCRPSEQLDAAINSEQARIDAFRAGDMETLRSLRAQGRRSPAADSGCQ